MANRSSRRHLTLKDLPELDRVKSTDYAKALKDYQIKLVDLQRRLVLEQQRIVLVFEGMDAAGKGGVIKRLTMYLDPRGFEVHAISAPVNDEKAHHYLRRFWLRLPPRGKMAIFDRSWYGRMLVEPIEGFCTVEEYARAGREIREFERLLVDDGYRLAKFWVHVSKDEQLRRFKARENDPLRVWKLTAEDWRNRERYDQYVAKAEAMFKETDADHAPWYLIHGNNKEAARLTMIGKVVSLLDGCT
jgi:polyphosphate kinase 2 (PPK2 family)